MITVPLATPTRMSGDEKFLVEGAVQRVLESSRWILGEEVTGFEEEFARYVGAPEVVGVGNGTDALGLAFLALEIPPGSEVIVCETDGGYGAVSARMVGLTPVPMEVDPHSFAPTADLAAQALSSRTRAVVITEHLLAHPGDSFLLSEGTFIDYDLHTPDSEIIVFASEAFQPMRSERIPSDD